MKYKIGYKQRGQWRYITIMGKLPSVMDMVKKLFVMGYAQVTIKIIKSEV